ncbi:MAG: signal peptidase II [Phycisphaerales bacterium]|nr:signal peptidase II [Phycisphaerales bacterium]
MIEPTTTVEPSVSAQADLPAWKSAAAWYRLLVILVAVVLLDLATKAWAFHAVAMAPIELDRETVLHDPHYQLPYHPGVDALPWGLLDFRLVLNHGAVFGIGQGSRLTFICFTIAATSAALLLFARGTRASMRLAHCAVALILAGGLGNLFDRMQYGAVRDFLHLLPGWNLPFGWQWPGCATSEVFPWIFNVADMSLLAGMALFIWGSWKAEKKSDS